MKSTFIPGIFFVLALACGSTFAAGSTTIVISQVYPGGGSSAAGVTYKKDYVELKNISHSPQSLAGLSLQYGSASGNFGNGTNTVYTLTGAVTLQPGKYYLIELGSPGTAGADIVPTPDQSTTNLSLSASSGHVALTNTATPLGCGGTGTLCTLPDARIIDLVAYGASLNGEGSSTVNNGVALPANTNGGVRKGAGCTDTDNNNLDFTVVVAPVPRNAGSTAAPCVGRHTNADFDGDGKTDYTVVRPSAGARPGMLGGGMVKGAHQAKAKFIRENPNVLNSPAATPLIWYTFGSAAGAISISQWGDFDTDDFIPADFDGDGKTDIAIWRPGAAGVAAFYIINSSDNTVRIQQYSESGYDPSVTADYDGDGKADPAVYGCTVPGQPSVCLFTFLGSLNNPTNAVTYIPWGFGQDGDFFPYVGDFDGDGRADFCIQRTQPGSPGTSQFALLHNDGIFFTSEFITWGNDSDFIIPGDYDGDGKTDFMVERPTPQGYIYFLLTRANTVQISGWGAANDQIAQGDYDGDGKTDIAVWRPAQAPNSGVFYVLTQTNAVQIAGWGTCNGLLCDVPVAGWQIR
ncbi:MAG: FG-GAP-like repeat-containing protein [Acidobacteriota bacterium]